MNHAWRPSFVLAPDQASYRYEGYRCEQCQRRTTKYPLVSPLQLSKAIERRPGNCPGARAKAVADGEQEALA